MVVRYPALHLLEGYMGATRDICLRGLVLQGKMGYDLLLRQRRELVTLKLWVQ